jgi:dihydrofolate synthase/folylpolyglutamate synthase
VGRRLLIFAGSRDKDLPGMLAVLAPHFERVFLTRFRTSQRGIAPEQALNMLPDAQRSRGIVCDSAEQAWQQARAMANEHDLVCVAGSVFLAGELRPLLLDDPGG